MKWQGHVKEPDYSEVCSGATGHTEAIQVGVRNQICDVCLCVW